MMGLLDVIKGMQNGPRGQPQPKRGGESGGMSPLMMALLALLAYKALKGRGGQPTAVPSGTGKPLPTPPQSGAPSGPGGLGDLLGGMLGGKPGSAGAPGGLPGGLGDILGGMFGGKPTGPGKPGAPGAPGNLGDLLGGLFGGAAAGGMLGGGLDSLIKDLQRQGYGKAAQSWISTGPNDPISPGDLEHAIGADTLDALAAQTGMSRSDLLQGLSQELPEMVDELTPNGRLPTEQELARWV
jgi:uncharacterized protein YidB (DUF937 family)